jgi:cellulose 1,4-beta-cellobiosidase
MHTPGTALFMLASLVVDSTTAFPQSFPQQDSTNPFLGKSYYAPSHYSNQIALTEGAFKSGGDKLNAARAKTVQSVGTFTWIANLASIPAINTAISEARNAKARTGNNQIVGLVLYNLPDRDCSGGFAAGEFSSKNNGLARYKAMFVDPYAAAVGNATDLTFAIVIEPDSIGNIVTNQAISFCASATPGYEAGIAYAISKLQMPHVALYLDAAHGGWLGWPETLPKAAAELSKVIKMAAALRPGAGVRGFSTNVAGFVS